jgi:hypothetical protein
MLKIRLSVLIKSSATRGKLIIKFYLNGKIPFLSTKTRDTNIFTRAVIDIVIKSRSQSGLTKCSSFTGVYYFHRVREGEF